MSQKIAVVTGSNKGIGFAIVRGLCKRFDGIVYLTSRNVKRGEKAVADLQKEGLNPQYHQLDITNKTSVETFRDYIKEKYGGIDVLVNNAAIAFQSDRTESVAVQAEQIVLVNYFATLSTCEILFPILRNGARVVNLSSSAGRLSNIPSEQLRQKFQDPKLTIKKVSDLMRGYIETVKFGTQAAEWGDSAYAVSKVGLTAITKLLQRLVSDKDIKVNAVHPGYVDTDMTLHSGSKTTDQGAEAPLYLALDAPDSVSGEHLWHTKEIISWVDGKSEEEY